MEIIAAVTRNLEFDLEPLPTDLLERLEEASEEYIWPPAE